MSWTNKDAEALRELLAPAGLIRRLFQELEGDIAQVNQVSSVQGHTVDELAINTAFKKGLVDGMLRTLGLIEEYSKENPDG